MVLPFAITEEQAEGKLEFVVDTWGAGSFFVTSMALYEGAPNNTEAPAAPEPLRRTPPPPEIAAPQHQAPFTPFGAPHLEQELAALHESTSWRMTAPLRAVVRTVRRQPDGDMLRLPPSPHHGQPIPDPAEIERRIAAMRTSTSWRLTAPLRAVARTLRNSPKE